MGEVYKARDTRLARTVAVKVLPTLLHVDPQARERFEREARAISALNHPHICTLPDVGSHDGVDFLVMEYVEGETLAARLTKGPLPLEQALSFAIDLASAMDRAHRSGIVHRDIKPGDVMVTPAGIKASGFRSREGLAHCANWRRERGIVRRHEIPIDRRDGSVHGAGTVRR
jgi:serine/threonine protein kinase